MLSRRRRMYRRPPSGSVSSVVPATTPAVAVLIGRGSCLPMVEIDVRCRLPRRRSPRLVPEDEWSRG